ncbi:MAG TPA: hypothetical protein VE222_12305 [Nitrospiraceae bacterium]|nr:hypothetical protein [Nitrospiraceae bacterium]
MVDDTSIIAPTELPPLTADELNTVLVFLDRSPTNGYQESIGLVKICQRIAALRDAQRRDPDGD